MTAVKQVDGQKAFLSSFSGEQLWSSLPAPDQQYINRLRSWLLNTVLNTLYVHIHTHTWLLINSFIHSFQNPTASRFLWDHFDLGFYALHISIIFKSLTRINQKPLPAQWLPQSLRVTQQINLMIWGSLA